MTQFQEDRLNALVATILSSSFSPEDVETIMNPPHPSTVPEELRAGIAELHARRNRALVEAHKVIALLFPTNPPDREDYKALFEAAAKARDEAGFVGTVPDCIEFLENQSADLMCLLHLFREFVIQNATQWKLGSNHHHPMWAMLAEAIGENREEIRSGPAWEFIQALNRIEFKVLDRLARYKNLDDEIPF